MVDCTFYKSTIKSNCVLLSCHVRVRSSRQELFCKKGVLRNFAKFLKKRLWHRCFTVSFAKFLRTSFLTEHHRWLLLAFHSESTFYSFRTSCSKQAQYLKFKSNFSLLQFTIKSRVTCQSNLNMFLSWIFKNMYDWRLDDVARTSHHLVPGTSRNWVS